MFWLKNVEVDVHRPAQKLSVKWKKGREIMVENENWALLFDLTNVAEIEFKTC